MTATDHLSTPVLSESKMRIHGLQHSQYTPHTCTSTTQLASSSQISTVDSQRKPTVATAEVSCATLQFRYICNQLFLGNLGLRLILLCDSLQVSLPVITLLHYIAVHICGTPNIKNVLRRNTSFIQNAQLNKCVFKRFLKVELSGMSWRSADSPFHDITASVLDIPLNVIKFFV